MSEAKSLCIAGPSGVGKSSLSYALAEHLNLPLTEVDDLFIAIEAITTPQQQPAIHHWNQNPLASTTLEPEQVLEIHLKISRALSPAIAALIANHTQTRLPIILEGDYLLPELIAANSDKVLGLVVLEDDPEQISRNYLRREPNLGAQSHRSNTSWLFGQWLRKECERYAIPVIAARPWDTVLARALQALNQTSGP